jgi:hypothetical protein
MRLLELAEGCDAGQPCVGESQGFSCSQFKNGPLPPSCHFPLYHTHSSIEKNHIQVLEFSKWPPRLPHPAAQHTSLKRITSSTIISPKAFAFDQSNRPSASPAPGNQLFKPPIMSPSTENPQASAQSTTHIRRPRLSPLHVFCEFESRRTTSTCEEAA